MKDKFINASRFSTLLNKIVVVIAVLVLAGWEFDVVLLKSILPTLVAMNPTVAVLFILSSIGLYLINEKHSAKTIKTGKYIGLLIAIIALIKIAGVNKDFDIEIDNIIYGNVLRGNRIAFTAGMNFLLVGLSIFFIDNRKKDTFLPSQVIALSAFVISLMAIIGYFYSSNTDYLFSALIPMPILTAITFLLLTAAILFSRYRIGFVAVLMDKNLGGFIIRRLLPISFSSPLIVSWLRLEGQRLNLYSLEIGSSLVVVVHISIFTSLLWWIANSLNKTDKVRKETELKLVNAKDELEVNEIKYRNLIENAGVVMYTTSINGIITFASSKAVHLTGYEINEIIGMHFTNLIDEEYLLATKAKYKNQVINNIKETLLEFCIRTKQGDLKWVEQSAVLLIEKDLPAGFQCIVRDISTKKEMELVVKKYEIELIQNQGRLQSILDNATSLMYIKDLEGKYLLTNKRFKETLNVNDTIIGKTDFEFTDPKQAQRFKDTDAQVIKTGRSVELEDTIEMHDGTHNILIIKFPLVDAQNKIYGISGIATDITERVRYQQQLIEAKKIAEDAKKMQEQFLANMSHEIRTPMNGIQGMTDLLLETELNNEQFDFAKTIKRSSNNLLVIINDILDFSKIKAGKLTIEKIDFKLAEVLENIRVIFKHRIIEKGLTLNITVHDDVPVTLNGDPYRLNQILVNIIGNAIKFTHTGGINVSIFVQGKSAKKIVLNFKITDNGIGIENNKINEIFESFTQASIETSRKYGGTGLGLSITKQLVEMQQGNIAVESEINKGTTFTISIPYNYSKNNAPSLFVGDAKNYRSFLKGKKFLVAEDNEVNQKVIRHVLQKAGGIVDIANNGLEAVSFLKQNNDYHLIIMDLQMPEMDGYAATKYIRKVMKISTPIIAMTASALKGEKSKCIEIGMNDYLSKPFDFSVIYKRISVLLSDNPVDHSEEVFDIPGSENLYDLCLLEEMNDNDYISEILTIFLNNTPNELNELQKASASKQFDAIYKLAHKLKSSMGLLKANQLVNILIKIEENAKSENGGTLTSLIEEANEAYKKIETPLQEHLKNVHVTLGIAV